MDLLAPLLFIAFGVFVIKNAEQRQRIAWLSAILGPIKLEKSIETLATGYMRALAETDPERSEPIWRMLEGSEATLVQQLDRLAKDIQTMPPAQARISRWSMALPMATRLFPDATFDLREAFRVHAKGFAQSVTNAEGLSRKQQARRLLAEMLLFQHTCHWYCRSKSVASARLMVRHQATHEETLALVSPQTRQGYQALLTE
ncbi:hypothetical protein LPB72_13005 [Hydrogenophaga crassostreae]|uniref:Uncharacterized protein n=1 Tax=Hydrogenophaga crassostreae TaxID=1763535 RepID=A0A167HLZ3_9BURK|nr:hypothetical protein [Hydrogenophaga crassostreae]AOW14979.1 hypothetical protein LPB072_21330 [Hydrogenophaga crassostreae]OAD41431.1 hypothetical protein LPB72_13005 [Hydrogenophaga crassostreae]